MSNEIVIESGDLRAKVNPINGQLFSLTRGEVEFFHGAGGSAPVANGWSNSEIVCFPVFGSVREYIAQVGNNVFALDKHGIARCTDGNPFMNCLPERDSLSLDQIYDGSPVRNPKSPVNAQPAQLTWLPYTLAKTFQVGPNGLTCDLRLTNDSGEIMPYIFGWHPAFRVLGDVESGVFFDESSERVATLADVVAASTDRRRGVYQVNGRGVTYLDQRTGHSLRVSSESFGDTTLLWSPGLDAGMFCVEHVTQLPPKGAAYFGEHNAFEGTERLSPGETKSYRIQVEPIVNR